MTVNGFSVALKSALAIAFAALALPAYGLSVTYSTTGEFCATTVAGSCPAGSPNSVIFGSYPNETYIRANPLGPVAVTAPTNNAVATTFEISDIGNAGPGSGFFTLAISETAPAIGSGQLTGALSGSYSVGSSSASIAFSSGSLTIGDMQYTLIDSTYTFPTIGPPSHLDTIFMDVSLLAPEPTFITLTGLGFAGIVLLMYRRRRRVV